MVLLRDRFDFPDFRGELRRKFVYGFRIILLLIGFRKQGDETARLNLRNTAPVLDPTTRVLE
jgi:hypothetical protein